MRRRPAIGAGSAAREAVGTRPADRPPSAAPGYVRRFSRTERLLHWVNAAGFMKDVHFWAGIGWVSALALVALLGDRRGLLRTAREIDGFASQDVNWLRRRRPAEQDRFNAGQKLNAALTAAFLILFFVSGMLLWLGERDTTFRFASTVLLHDGLLYASLALLVGHLYLAVIHPATRHALRGMLVGTVREDWAHEHHARWDTSD